MSIKLALRILASIPIWSLYVLSYIPLLVAGLILIPIQTKLGRYERRKSKMYPNRTVTAWKDRWMWWWGNEEDGIDGYPTDTDGHLLNMWWRERTATKSHFKTIFQWSALRNSVSNIRFSKCPFWSLKINPSKVRSYMFEGEKVYGWFSWQGYRSNLFLIFGGKWRFWIGWKIEPRYEDFAPATKLPDDELRSKGAGFAIQFKKV